MRGMYVEGFAGLLLACSCPLPDSCRVAPSPSPQLPNSMLSAMEIPLRALPSSLLTRAELQGISSSPPFQKHLEKRGGEREMKRPRALSVASSLPTTWIRVKGKQLELCSSAASLPEPSLGQRLRGTKLYKSVYKSVYKRGTKLGTAHLT